MSIGESIRRIRKAKGISIQTIANMLHTQVSAISLIERDLKMPKISTLTSIANALGVPLADILGEELYREYVMGKYGYRKDLGMFSDDELIREVEWRQRLKDMGLTMENQILRRRTYKWRTER